MSTLLKLQFLFSLEWFTESGDNICIISYAYTTEPESNPTIINLSKTVSEHRVAQAAELGSDLIKGVQDVCWNDDEGGKSLNIHEVNVIGFSFGTKIASKTCENVSKKTKGEKVKMLLGMYFATKNTF